VRDDLGFRLLDLDHSWPNSVGLGGFTLADDFGCGARTNSPTCQGHACCPLKDTLARLMHELAAPEESCAQDKLGRPLQAQAAVFMPRRRALRPVATSLGEALGLPNHTGGCGTATCGSSPFMRSWPCGRNGCGWRRANLHHPIAHGAGTVTQAASLRGLQSARCASSCGSVPRTPSLNRELSVG